MAKQTKARRLLSHEMGASRGNVSIVELSISCSGLVDSKSYSMCVLSVDEFAGAKWKEFDRTEVIENNCNPTFVKKFVMEYLFEESQKLKFDLYNAESQTAPLTKQAFLGSMQCTLGEIVSSTRLQKPLTGLKHDKGSIEVSAEEMSSCKKEATMQFCGKQLGKKGRPNPFLLFSRTNEDGIDTLTHKTEVSKGTQSPTWRPFTVPLQTLCNGDYDRSIKVECYNWNKDGRHELIGELSVTMRELSQGPSPDTVYECINTNKTDKKSTKYQKSGTIELLNIEIKSLNTFLDYIKGGTNIQVTISVDFTSSNGNPQEPSSLHYKGGTQPNMYALALRAVGEIIVDYDTNKFIPALGFGAKVPPEWRVSHEFFLNFHEMTPYCRGIEGVLKAYHKTLETVRLDGPTNFAPCINHVAKIAELLQDGSNYFILLILTDGVIRDMPQTCQAIVNASRLPISIIIVGIGDADFEAMKALDADDIPISSRGKFAERDIVQFVSFREFLGGENGNDLVRSQAALAKEVLAEIPDQFLSFMEKHKISPRPPIPDAPVSPARSESNG